MSCSCGQLTLCPWKDVQLVVASLQHHGEIVRLSLSSSLQSLSTQQVEEGSVCGATLRPAWGQLVCSVEDLRLRRFYTLRLHDNMRVNIAMHVPHKQESSRGYRGIVLEFPSYSDFILPSCHVKGDDLFVVRRKSYVVRRTTCDF